jgi:hypothetical protein
MELITRDLKDILYDIKQLSAALYQDKRDIDLTFNMAFACENDADHIERLSDGLVEASGAIDLRSDQLDNIEKYLVKLMEDLEYAVLSDRVQQK